MATLPYFVLGPSALLSLLGLVRGPDTTEPTPAEDWVAEGNPVDHADHAEVLAKIA